MFGQAINACSLHFRTFCFVIFLHFRIFFYVQFPHFRIFFVLTTNKPAKKVPSLAGKAEVSAK